MDDKFSKGEIYYPSATKADNDFIGFSLGGIHCFDLGIKRTSGGSRFNENLLPTIQDKTVPVPGGDGMYYFGSYYTQRQFSVSFAFDSLTEEQLRKLKKWLGNRNVQPIIFDECPYKEYRGKITGSATIKHIAFEDDGQRIYKGEGSIQFTCYDPFARTRKDMPKALDQYEEEAFPTKKEWAPTSGLIDTMDKLEIYQILSKKEDETKAAVPLYNPGDFETDFILTIKKNSENSNISIGTISIDDELDKSLEVEDFTLLGNDAGVKVSSRNNLIMGIDDNGVLTGNLYNEHILSGNFFKIPCCGEKEKYFKMSGSSSGATLDYDYLYF